MKKKTSDMTNDKREIRIFGVGNTLHQELINITSHLGTSITDFAKTKLADVVHAYPEHYKKPMNND